MFETMVCPNCSAPLKFSAGGPESMECPYCHTIVRLGAAGAQAAGQTSMPAVSNNARAVLILLILGGLSAVILGIVVDHEKPATGPSTVASAKPQFATVTMEFGSKGITPGHFDGASHISLDNQGHIYVVDDTGRVQVFDTTGKYLSEFSAGRCDDMVADREGTLFIAMEGKICRFRSATGEQLPDMERGIDDQMGKQSPVYYRCVCLTSGVVNAITGYAVDVPNVVKLSATTGKIESTIVAKPPADEILNLHGILVLTTGEIYGVDTEKEAIFKFSPGGAFINEFGGASGGAGLADSPPSQLQSPSSVASDSQGRIYVGNADGIKVYDKDGNYIDKFGDGQFPRGIAIDDHDNIYACFNDCVREYELQKH